MNFIFTIVAWITSFFLNRKKDQAVELGEKSQQAKDQKVTIAIVKNANDIQNVINRASDAAIHDELYSRWKRK